MTPRLAPYRLRPATLQDVPACVAVFHASMEALLVSRKEAIPPRNSPPLQKLFEHLVANDPGDAWVALPEGSEDIVGFAMANRRGDRWFLSFLFILEAWQAGGLGRALLARVLPRGGDWRLGVCAEAIQPVSTALYARHGMVPRQPIYLLAGELRQGALSFQRERLDATPFVLLDDEGPHEPGGGAPLGEHVLARLAALDRAVAGVERPADHRFARATGRVGLLFHRPGDRDATLGYGYVQPSGRIGPVLVREPWMLTPALAELTDAVVPMAGWQAIVPGVAAHALRPLLDGGLRIEGGPAVYGADWDGPPFDRYLPMGFGLV
jgi:GNAT superfamily N-acetyltransferase